MDHTSFKYKSLAQSKKRKANDMLGNVDDEKNSKARKIKGAKDDSSINASDLMEIISSSEDVQVESKLNMRKKKRRQKSVQKPPPIEEKLQEDKDSDNVEETDNMVEGNISEANVQSDHRENDTMNTSSAETITVPSWEHKLSKKERKKKKLNEKLGIKLPDPTSTYPVFIPNANGFKSKSIGMTDVRELILWTIGDGVNPSWMLVRNRQHIKRFLLLHIPGLDPSAFGLPYETYKDTIRPVPLAQLPTDNNPSLSMPFFLNTFTHLIPTRAPGEKGRIYSPVNALLQCPLSTSEKERRQNERAKEKHNPAIRQPNYYILTLEQLIEGEYPVHSLLDPSRPFQKPDFVETLPAKKPASKPHKLIALDCEMCRTVDGNELTRVSLVDGKGTIIYDELVMPVSPILDYLTEFSGITAKRLEGVTTTLAQVQDKLLELIDHNTILVGHSIDCDLRALKLAHPHIIDTARMYHHTRGPSYRPGLKWLAGKWLNREIQKGGVEHGHDSIEDATTCMDLLKLKMKSNPGFGEFMVDTESIFTRFARGNKARWGAVVDFGTAATIHGAAARKVVKVDDDDAAVEGILDVLQDHDFVFARLRGVEGRYGQEERGKWGEQWAYETLKDALVQLDARLKRIWEGLSKPCAVVIVSGVGDCRESSKLSAKQTQFKQLWQTTTLSLIPQELIWDPVKDQKALEDAVEKAKYGASFFAVK